MARLDYPTTASAWKKKLGYSQRRPKLARLFSNTKDSLHNTLVELEVH